MNDTLFPNENEDMTATEFASYHGVTAEVTRLLHRGDGLMTEMPALSSHYKVVLSRLGKKIETNYSMGPAHTSGPTVGDVLHSLGLDASAYESSTDLSDFMANMGYENRAHARKVYKACARVYDNLTGLLGEALRDQLMYEVEE